MKPYYTSKNNTSCLQNTFCLLTKKNLMKVYKPRAYNWDFMVFENQNQMLIVVMLL